MMRPVTIKDVAGRAGVAVSTVSRVLNNMDRVSEQTRRQVQDAISELGYVRNNMAASIKTGCTRFIVVVVPDIINEFFTAVIRGVEEVASARGYYTLVYTTGESHTKENEIFRGEFGRIVDGIILIPSTANGSNYTVLDKPTVMVDRDVSGDGLYRVVIDNYKGARLLMDEVLAHGHRKVAIVTGPTVFNVGVERMNGYVDVLRENNIAVRPEYVKSGTWYQEDGYRMTRELMELQDPPTAIFAANNLLGIGCVECLLDMGMAIGKDISVVSFDDSTLAQYLGKGGITSIRRPTSRMGILGAELLLDILEKRDMSQYPHRTVLDVELVRRESVAWV